MRDLQSSIAEITSTVEAALKRQSDQGLLPSLLDAMHAIETTTIMSRNGVKKQLVAFDQRIHGLSTNVCALKDELVTQGGKPDKATTSTEGRQDASTVSVLMAEVLSQGVKLDKAVVIIEIQQEMMKTLLDLMQKGSVEIKGGILDGQTSPNTSSTRPEPVVNNSSQPLRNLALPDPPVDVNGSVSEPHSTADALAPTTTCSIPIESPAILHSDHTHILVDQSNKPEADADAMVVDAPSADAIGITIATVEERLSADVNNITETAPHPSPTADTVGQVEESPPVLISDTTTVIANPSQSTLDTPDPVSAGAASEKGASNIMENVDQDAAPYMVVE